MAALDQDAAGRLRVLLVAPGLDGTDVGEVYSAFRWVEALTALADVTLLTYQRADRKPIAEQLPNATIVSWQEPSFLAAHFERFNAAVQPALPLFFRHVRRWIKRAQAAGRMFDIAHQIVPQAMRYASPLRGLGIPYVVGPLGGGLTTPEPFRAECGSDPWFMHLRTLDRLRLEYDPWLRAGYADAALVLGVAPYVREALQSIPLKHFESVLERGNEGLAPEIERQNKPNVLKMLHVGRGVRTKGLRDIIRALERLPDLPSVTLTSAGGGEEIDVCRRLAVELGVSDRTTFLGSISRQEVETLYANSDAFVFPSFREPMGGVLFEALRWGLPIVAARRGGPDWIIDDSCGLKVEVTAPETYADDLAKAIRRLAANPELRLRLGEGARVRLSGFGTWEDKAERLIELYREVLNGA